MDRGMPEEPGRVEESIDEKNNNKYNFTWWSTWHSWNPPFPAPDDNMGRAEMYSYSWGHSQGGCSYCSLTVRDSSSLPRNCTLWLKDFIRISFPRLLFSHDSVLFSYLVATLSVQCESWTILPSTHCWWILPLVPLLPRSLYGRQSLPQSHSCSSSSIFWCILCWLQTQLLSTSYSSLCQLMPLSCFVLLFFKNSFSPLFNS